MSLMGTLAKVAIGVAMAKGASSLATGRKGGTAGAGSGSIFGDLLSPGGSGSAQQGGAGGLSDILKDLSGGSAGGIGGLGGLGAILSGKSGAGGGLGGMLDGLSQASRPTGGTEPSGGSLGELLNQSLDRFGEPDTAPSPDQEDAARLLLRAMLQAAKSDGRIDEDEKKNLLGQVGDISKDEMAYINEELSRPVDVNALANDTQASMASQVYSMSLLAIDLDSKNEANYLHELAQALNISPRDANAIHEQMGEPKLYS